MDDEKLLSPSCLGTCPGSCFWRSTIDFEKSVKLHRVRWNHRQPSCRCSFGPSVLTLSTHTREFPFVPLVFLGADQGVGLASQRPRHRHGRRTAATKLLLACAALCFPLTLVCAARLLLFWVLRWCFVWLRCFCFPALPCFLTLRPARNVCVARTWGGELEFLFCLSLLGPLFWDPVGPGAFAVPCLVAVLV